jgi:hypothetical protein
MSWLSKAARKVKQFFKRLDPQTWRDLRRIRDEEAQRVLAEDLVQLTAEGRRLLEQDRACKHKEQP